MFRSLTQRLCTTVYPAVRQGLLLNRGAPAAIASRGCHGSGLLSETSDEDLVKMFEQCEDGWDFRSLVNNLQGADMVPAPSVIIAALHVCRRLNEHSLAVRYLEAVQWKCGKKKDEIWPYLLKHIQPTLDELGISTPEELGMDKPQFAMAEVDDM